MCEVMADSPAVRNQHNIVEQLYSNKKYIYTHIFFSHHVVSDPLWESMILLTGLWYSESFIPKSVQNKSDILKEIPHNQMEYYKKASLTVSEWS